MSSDLSRNAGDSVNNFCISTNKALDVHMGTDGQLRNGKPYEVKGPTGTIDYMSIKAAMQIPYSGEFDFVSTTYVFPTTHMVAPKDHALACNQCHQRKDGRLANITGVYMPGRDRVGLLDTLGWVAVIGSLTGVCIHGLGRVVTNGNSRKEG
jgi:hypothetical protein